MKVTKSGGTQMMEKLGITMTDVSDGINLNADESTSAEEYFSSTQIIELILDQFITDMIVEAIEKIESDDSSDNLQGSSTNLRRSSKTIDKKLMRHSTGNIMSGANLNFKLDDSKRLSCISKTSTDSNNSNFSDCKDKTTSLSFDPITDSTISDIESGDVNEVHNDTSKLINDKKTTWEKAKETIDKVKKNVDILRQNSERASSEEKRKNFEKIHPFHTHMLLYYGVYDTKQVLYAFQTLRNIISCDCRTFICLSMTTAVSNNEIKQLLVRHKKSLSGKGFTGTIINTEFSHAYRGCMYLEALVTICLYYARGYFQKESTESNDIPTSKDIYGNYQIQMASIELLTLLCTELITIIKDMGKGLACYIADLMAKCKLQKVSELLMHLNVNSFY